MLSELFIKLSKLLLYRSLSVRFSEQRESLLLSLSSTANTRP
jgi:hypothetical protein